MIEITDAHLMDDDTSFRRVFLLIQTELDVAVFTGAGAVLVTAGERLAPLTGFDVQANPLPPIEVPGFTGVVNDLHLSRIFASWTTERGGALRLRATFEEEGVELRGGLIDLDLDHLHLDVFLLPSLDSTDTVVWDMQLDFQLDGGVLSDALRGRIEESLVSSGIVSEVTNALAPITDQLNLLFGLSARAVRSIVVEQGKATFDDVPADTPRFSVVFDAVEVHDDGDGNGQGELMFSATVGDVEVESTESVSAGSGTVVPLEGAQWRVSPELEDGLSVSVRFEAFDADGDNLTSLGFVNVDLDPDDAPRVMELPSSRNDFTLLARLEPRDVKPPAGARHLRVSLSNVKVLRDQDGAGAGEVRFWALAAGQPTGVSEERKARGSGNPDIDPSLSVDLHLRAGEDLDLRVIGWDVDPSQRDWMGEVVAVVPAGDIGEGDPLVLESDTGDFEATITVVDLDAPPADGGGGDGGGPTFPPGTETVRRLVVLESLTVRPDGDDVGPGELRITATLTRTGTDDVVTMHNDVPIETSAGAVLPLVDVEWRTELEVAVAGRLTVTASVVDVDVRPDDPFTPQNEAQETETPLGEARLTFDAGDDHGLGRHVLASDDGNVAFRLRILDPAAQRGEVQAVVRFEEVDILHDHTTPGRAALWSAAYINGFPVGDGTELKAGNGDTIVLEGAAWEIPVGLDPGEQLELGFEVFEARDPSHLSLGRVAVGEPLPWPGGRHSVTSDQGDFTLHYRVWDPTVQDVNRLSVTFLEIAVLDDGEPSSEGELRFVGAADELWTGLSVLQKARKGETLPLVGTSWRLEPELAAGDELTVAFSVYAEDADAFARLDRVEQRFGAGDGWGLGEHVVTSPDEKFRIRYAIAPATEEGLPDLPDLVPLLVEFTSVQVHDDGDGLTKGDISCTGTVNGVTVLQTEPVKVDAGELVPLGAPLAPRTIWLPSDQDLEIALTASEHDGRQADVLGTSRHVHRAADGWELGAQEIRSPGGAITASWRVDRADGPKARVKFLHVHVFDDDEPVKRGDFVCEATVNDVSTGLSSTMKAGSDGASSDDDLKSDIFIGGPRWTKTVAFDPDDPRIAVRFTLIELDGRTSQDVLGTVEVDAADAFGSINEMQSYTQLADSGKYQLTFVAQTLGTD